MEEQVNNLGGLLGDVAAFQRETLARRSVVASVRANQTVSRSFRARFNFIPRMRYALPAFAMVGALAVWWGLRPAPLSFAVSYSVDSTNSAVAAERPGRVGERLEAPRDHGLPLRFSDGSLVALDRGARVQITSLGSNGASLQLEKGRAEVNVHHRLHTRWHLRAGSFEVTVTGTRFSIDWEDNAQALTLVMTEGTVEVRGYHLPGGSPIIVTAGQRFQASARQPHWTLASSAAPPSTSVVPIRALAVASPSGDVPTPSGAPPSLAPPPEDAPPATLAPAPMGSGHSGSAAPRSWQVLGASGHYQEALGVAEKSGFTRACRRLGADDVVQLGDVARLAQNVPRAEEAYHAARRRFPSADRPAFGLGLIAFDQRRDFRAAARWFDTYVREFPRGPLAREAAGRAMESWHRAGDKELARRAARDYLKQAPSGPYAPLARQIAAP